MDDFKSSYLLYYWLFLYIHLSFQVTNFYILYILPKILPVSSLFLILLSPFLFQILIFSFPCAPFNQALSANLLSFCYLIYPTQRVPFVCIACYQIIINVVYGAFLKIIF